jgi:hypothetical protein
MGPNRNPRWSKSGLRVRLSYRRIGKRGLLKNSKTTINKMEAKC